MMRGRSAIRLAVPPMFAWPPATVRRLVRPLAGMPEWRSEKVASA